ncbi:MAG: hypothetical protein KAG14_02945 [Mycoplasmataceae bacterium]|nr:hypothetical protein [Mycoplasmataceae bacterium]
MAQNHKKIKAQKKLVENLTKEEHPIKMSIIIFVFWEVVVIILAILFYFLGNNTVPKAIEVAAAVGIAISIIWIMLRVGVLEGGQLKYKNWKNGKIVDKFGENQNIKMSLEQHRNLVKKRSWVGVGGLFTINLIITLSVAFI